MTTATERKLANYEIENGCRIWRGHKDKDGYGKVYANGTMNLVHRLSYSFYCAPIPAGLDVYARCGRRDCLRPEHLALGTAAERARRREQRR
jgi:HNH endonuclease